MLKENEFMITDWKSFKMLMSFQVITMDDTFDQDVKISCAEDIEEVMKLYLTKDWKALFHDYNQTYCTWYRNVCDVDFEGLYIVAKEKDKGHVYFRMESSPKVTVTVNPKTMGDKSAEKVAEIRKILNS